MPLCIYESDEQKTDGRKSLKEPDESEFLSKDYIREERDVMGLMTFY